MESGISMPIKACRKTEVIMVSVLKTQVFWSVMHFQARISRHSEGSPCLHLHTQAVQDECLTAWCWRRH